MNRKILFSNFQARTPLDPVDSNSLITYATDDLSDEETSLAKQDEVNHTNTPSNNSDSSDNEQDRQQFWGLSSAITDTTSYEDLLDLTERIGSVSKGVSYTTVRKCTRKFLVKGNIEEKCVICLESFAIGDSGRILYCNHIFHKICIEKWFRSSKACPICQQEFCK
jgi:hypothetical protein